MLRSPWRAGQGEGASERRGILIQGYVTSRRWESTREGFGGGGETACRRNSSIGASRLGYNGVLNQHRPWSLGDPSPWRRDAVIRRNDGSRFRNRGVDSRRVRAERNVGAEQAWPFCPTGVLFSLPSIVPLEGSRRLALINCESLARNNQVAHLSP